MVNLKQTFEVYDYLGPLAVALAFACIVFFLSFLLLNFLFVRTQDELTVFERFGSRHNVRLGPHRLDSIRRRQEHAAALLAAEIDAAEHHHLEAHTTLLSEDQEKAPGVPSASKQPEQQQIQQPA